MSLRIHLALAFLICSTLVLGILGVIADQGLATRLAEQQEHLTHASIDRLAKVLAEPVWTLNTSQVHDLMQAELAGSPHLGFSAGKLKEKDVMYYFPILEIVLMSSQFYLFIINIFTKPVHWK